MVSSRNRIQYYYFQIFYLMMKMSQHKVLSLIFPNIKENLHRLHQVSKQVRKKKNLAFQSVRECCPQKTRLFYKTSEEDLISWSHNDIFQGHKR